VEKLRKIGERLWYNKERMVLAILVVVLGWNVYKVVNPPTGEKPPDYRPPSGALPPDWRPVEVPLPPDPRIPGQWEMVYMPNPLWYYSTQSPLPKKTGEEDPGISLLRIRTVRDKACAQLQTANTRKWYYEGDAFESFVLLKINVDEGTCLVRSERLGRNVTLRVP
jgi:hypothetical protein